MSLRAVADTLRTKYFRKGELTKKLSKLSELFSSLFVVCTLTVLFSHDEKIFYPVVLETFQLEQFYFIRIM